MSGNLISKDRAEFFESIKSLSEESQKEIIDIYKTEIKAHHANEEIKLTLKQSTHFMNLGFGSILALSAFLLAAYAIYQKANLLDLAALITPIAGLAGVFLWGFQRKN
jgi:hypothetical protein